MAQVRRDKIQVEVEINGQRQVVNDIRDIQSAYRQLNREVQRLPIGSEQYNAKMREMARLGKIIDQHKQKQKALRQEIDKLPASSNKFLSGLKRIGAAAVAAFSVQAVFQFGKSLFTTSQELDAFERKAKTVFGSALESVEAFADANAEALGLSRQEYITSAAAAGDLLIPMGFQREEAASLSTGLVNLSGALSEWSGGQRSATEVSDILTKALLGEREQLKTLGISILEADVQTRLAEKGQKKLTGTALQQAKALATLELITEKSADAQTQFAKSGESAARQAATARARFTEIREELAQALLPVVSKSLKFFADFGRSLLGITKAISASIDPAKAATEAFDDQRKKVSGLEKEFLPLLDKYDDLQGRTDLSKKEQEELNKVIAQIGKTVPSAITEFDKYGVALDINSEKARAFVATQQAILGVKNAEAIELQTAALSELQIKYDRLNAFLNGTADSYGDIKRKGEEFFKSQSGGFGQYGTQLTKISKDVIGPLFAELGGLQQRITGTQGLLAELSGGQLYPIVPPPAADDPSPPESTGPTPAEIKKRAAERRKADQELQNLRIELMAAGLQKVIAQIELNTQKEIDALSGSQAQKVEAERLLLIKQAREINEAETAARLEGIASREEEIKAAAERELALLISTGTKRKAETILIEKTRLAALLALSKERQAIQADAIESEAKISLKLVEGPAEGNEQKRLDIEEKLQQDLAALSLKYSTDRKQKLALIANQELVLKAEQIEAEKKAQAKAFEEELQALDRFLEERSKRITGQVIERAEQGSLPVDQIDNQLNEQLLQASLDYLEQKKALEEKFGRDSLQTERDLQAARLEIIKEGNAAEEAAARAKNERIFDMASSSASAANDLAAQFFQQRFDEEIASIEAREAKALAIAGDSEAEKAKIEAKFRAEKEAAQLAQKKKEKAQAIIQTIIDTAVSIVKTGASLGYPAAIPFQVQAGIIGGVQAALIAGQKYEKGDILKDATSLPQRGRGGITKGRRHSQGGIQLIDRSSGQEVGEAEGGELILSRNFVANNQAWANKALYSSKYLNGAPIFEDGGILSAPSTTPGPAMLETAAQFSEANIVTALRSVEAAIYSIELRIGEREADNIAELQANYQRRKNQTFMG